MASRIVIRRFASQLPKLDSAALHEQVKTSAPARAFAAAATKAQDDSAVEVGRTSKEQSPAVSARNRAWPKSILPGLFSPLYQPTSLTQMMDTMDRLCDFPFLSGVPTTMMSNATNRTPWDVMEDEKCFKLRVDMPGMSKGDVKLSVEDGDLTMKAEHDTEKKEDDWSSRSYGSYNVRIKLPENVDFSGIKAEMKDGVLKVVAPKVEGAKQKHEVQIE